MGGVGLGELGARHASGRDVQELARIIQADRIERSEYSIEDLERRHQNITKTADLNDQQRQEVVQIELLKDRELRKLDRMLGAR